MGRPEEDGGQGCRGGVWWLSVDKEEAQGWGSEHGGGAPVPGCALSISLEGLVVMGSCWIPFA